MEILTIILMERCSTLCEVNACDSGISNFLQSNVVDLYRIVKEWGFFSCFVTRMKHPNIIRGANPEITCVAS